MLALFPELRECSPDGCSEQRQAAYTVVESNLGGAAKDDAEAELGLERVVEADGRGVAGVLSIVRVVAADVISRGVVRAEEQRRLRGQAAALRLLRLLWQRGLHEESSDQY